MLSRSRDGRRVAVLHGLGGIGKKQLMIEYAKRHRTEYSAIFWVNSKDSIKQSLVAVHAVTSSPPYPISLGF